LSKFAGTQVVLSNSIGSHSLAIPGRTVASGVERFLATALSTINPLASRRSAILAMGSSLPHIFLASQLAGSPAADAVTRTSGAGDNDTILFSFHSRRLFPVLQCGRSDSGPSFCYGSRSCSDVRPAKRRQFFGEQRDDCLQRKYHSGRPNHRRTVLRALRLPLISKR